LFIRLFLAYSLLLLVEENHSKVTIPLLFSRYFATSYFLELYLPVLPLACTNRTIAFAPKEIATSPSRPSKVIHYVLSVVVLSFWQYSIQFLCFLASSIYFAGLKYDT
jgi:hypothetical protein